MIDPDIELQLLEKEFPKSRRSWIKDTPVELDETLLSLAAHHAPYLEAQYRLKQENKQLKPGFGPGKEPPTTYKPSNVDSPGLRAIRKPPAQLSFSEEILLSASMSESKSVEPPPLPGAEKILTMLRDASPQEWLDRIASIVQLGEVELAMYLLNEYRARF